MKTWLWNPAESYRLSLHSQALLRMGLGFAVLVETAERMFYFRPLLSARGLFPVAFARELQRADLLPVIHFFLPSDLAQFVLVFVQFLLGLLVILGGGGRWMVLALLYFICSANLRTIAIAGGDVMFAWTAVLLLFAPAYSAWTVSEPERVQTSRVQFFGALIFMFGLYYACGATKNGSTWIHGDAVALSISDSFMATPIGHWLAGYTSLCRWLTFITVPLETWGVLLLLVPSPAFRLLTCTIFIGFHAAMASCFYLPTLTILMTSLWLAWIPDEFWSGPRRFSLEPPGLGRAWLSLSCLAACALIIVAANLKFISPRPGFATISDRVENVAERLGIYAVMKFFSPDPDPFNGWIRYVVSDNAGQKRLYDPVQQHFVEDGINSIPRNVFVETIHSHRWKSVIRLMLRDRAALERFANYTCEQLPASARVDAIYFRRKLDLTVVPTIGDFTPITLFHKDCHEAI